MQEDTPKRNESRESLIILFWLKKQLLPRIKYLNRFLRKMFLNLMIITIRSGRMATIGFKVMKSLLSL
ncbi:hypothetical protein C3F00_035445 [Pseudomonas sp. MWU13-2860]|nr:hypothetical protein C3F00_035445 [Pseudomonas sp. MWU13-2860]